MENQEQRRDGLEPERDEVPRASRNVLRSVAVLLILAGGGLILFGIWASMLVGWGGEDVPSGLLIAFGIVVIATGILMLASTKGRKEQS